MRTFTNHERRARLARRHFLAPETMTTDLVEMAGGLVGLHASDPATVFLSARARMPVMKVADMEAALYENRTLLKVLGMRRTMFVVPVELAPVLDAGCAAPLVPGEVRRLEQMLVDGGITDRPGPWLRRVMAETEQALAKRGPALATQLSQDVPELALQIAFGEGKRWAGKVGVSTRILFLLATTGRIVRARPRGSWLSSQYHWVRTEDWLPQPLPHINAESARAELARRWLRSYGPASINDLKWWSGWTLTQTRAAVTAAGAVEVELEDGPGLALAGDLHPEPPPTPAAWLLPSLDSTVMGWKERSWYLGNHHRTLFDSNGNSGPTVWWDGRVVGGWAQRPEGEVVYRLLEPVPAEAETAITREVENLQRWLNGSRVIPRFRTPLEKELGA